MDNSKLYTFLKGFMTAERAAKLEAVAAERSKHICVVLEDIFQSHNASAVLRSCDCFGVQQVHFIENKNNYEINPEVAMGSQKWLSITHHTEKENNTLKTYEQLRKEGFTIVATTPHTNDITLDQLPIDKKIALVFGTELNGLSEEAIKHADCYMRIPMYGFTESFNISVSAALCLHHLTEKIRASKINWQLSPEEKDELLVEWAKNTVKSADQLIENWKKDQL